MNIALLPLLAPLALLLSAGLAFLNPGPRPRHVSSVAEFALLTSILIALVSIGVVVRQGPLSGPWLGSADLGVSVRLDPVSATMFLLVAFIGWIVSRYSASYMDGETRQGAFTAWLCMTLASVFLLVLAGGLVQLLAAWIATSLFLHRLLLFYPDRVAAQRAARKKFVTARIADVALLAACACMFADCGTPDIAAILQSARTSHGTPLTAAAAAFLMIAGMLKSAQFPTHGWLTEVMETPTPVSALLHAGVINAGGFLLIRFADVMLCAPVVLVILGMVGGFTAIFGCLVMLTQPSVKTSLAWSTVGQMGFMMLECGLGLFPLALLHIIAHSLYKAHSFLVSGSAIETIAAIRRPGPIAIPEPAAVGRAFLIALVIYVLVAVAFGFAHKSPQAIALGAILIFGVAYLLAQGFADAAPSALTRRTAGFAVVTSVSYFALQVFTAWATSGTLPAAPTPGPLEWALILFALISFGLVAVLQASFSLWAFHPAFASVRVHLANGFYANAVFDRLLGGWKLRSRS